MFSQGPSSPTSAEITFDGGVNITGKSLDFSILGLPVTGSDPQNIVIHYSESGEIFEIAGASFHPDLTTSLTSAYTNQVYDFRAQGSISGNVAVLDLALAPGSVTDTSTLFTSYSASVIYTDISYSKTLANIAAIQADPVQNPSNFTLAEVTASIETNHCGSWCNGDGTLTLLEFGNFIDNYVDQAGTGDDWISNMKVLRGVVNPAYFDANGFVSSWDGSRGVIANGTPAQSAPTGYAGLSTNGVTSLVPNDVTNAAVSFTF